MVDLIFDIDGYQCRHEAALLAVVCNDGRQPLKLVCRVAQLSEMRISTVAIRVSYNCLNVGLV
jgi:hypothetical protein